METPQIFYRYEKAEWSDGHVELRLIKLNLHKETEKGYWIGYGIILDGKIKSTSRWIPKESKRRYAYPTKKEALTNFLKRTSRSIAIMSARLEESRRVYALAKVEMEEIDNG